MNPRCEGDSLVIFGISSDFNNPRIPIFYKMGRFNLVWIRCMLLFHLDFNSTSCPHHSSMCSSCFVGFPSMYYRRFPSRWYCSRLYCCMCSLPSTYRCCMSSGIHILCCLLHSSGCRRI